MNRISNQRPFPQRKKGVEATYESIYALLYHLSILGFFILTVYLLENHPPYPHSDRDDAKPAFDLDLFGSLLLLFVIYAFSTLTKYDGIGKGKEIEIGYINGFNSKEERSSPNGKQTLQNDEKEAAFLHVNGEATTSSTRSTEEQIMDDIQSTGGGSKGSNSTGSEIIEAINGNQHELQQYELATTAIFDPHTGFLNRDQTLEWRGWMMVVFIVYQITNASNYCHNFIHILFTSFCWMSGYGHFAYFYRTNDYSFVRISRVLWRTNFIALFLCLSLGQQSSSYILYFFCPLQTYFFLITYLTMRIGYHMNYSTYGLRLKLMVLAFAVFLIWDVDSGLFWLLNVLIFKAGPPATGAPSGPLWEWYYRSSLDHWSTFAGIVFAASAPIMALHLRKLESKNWHVQWMAKASIGFFLLCGSYLWGSSVVSMEHTTFNSIHAYIGLVPVLCYVFFRNISKTARLYTISCLKPLGETALEMYVVHHHLLLSSNGSKVLTILRGYPKCNLFLLVLLCYRVSQKLHFVSQYLCDMLLPLHRSDMKCRRFVGYMIAFVGSFYFMGFWLLRMEIATPRILALVIIVCGGLIYQTIMDMTWSKFHQGSNMAVQTNKVDIPHEEHESPIAKTFPLLFASMFICLLGFTWHMMALIGAGKINQLLLSDCELVANNGRWARIDTTCNEFYSGSSYRKLGLTSYGDCQQNFVWGWERQPSASLCRFTHRHTVELKTKLEKRTILFIGDITTQHMFHAVCRALGDNDANGFDSNNHKHGDIVKELSSIDKHDSHDISMVYKWAPLATDQVRKLREYEHVTVDMLPDLLVMGGGVMDALHVYATDEDQESHKKAIRSLAMELRNLGTKKDLPTVWITPPTIHTKALGTEEKRENMNEEEVENMRVLYSNLGVNDAASFVIDGPSFTGNDRVTESHDGIQYAAEFYDVGAQILFNALDWLLSHDDPDDLDPFVAPETGSMGSSLLGIMILLFAFLSLFFFDSYLGLSYISSVFSNGVTPCDLYEEAFNPILERMPKQHQQPIVKDGASNQDLSSSLALGDDKIVSVLENDETLSLLHDHDSERVSDKNR